MRADTVTGVTHPLCHGEARARRASNHASEEVSQMVVGMIGLPDSDRSYFSGSWFEAPLSSFVAAGCASP